MNASAPQLDDPERPRAESPRTATLKFTYASGARPLEGYTIKRGVGRGGFGEVYFATSDAGKEVALKLIRRNLDVELRGVTQCLNLKHPNLIALYDIKTDEMGDQWVVMEYVSGESLEDVIEHNPNGLPIDQVMFWMRGMCAGVAYLHDHGIVHRDLKPGNIFSDEGTVKIGDYGLAKFISCSRRSGQTESVGTVHYMAPEIANGRYGREIDTYALGIILFEMLTGHVPFEGESVGEVLMKHLTAEPDLSVLQEPYRDIVKRALAKDPNVRIKSVGELVALLPGLGELAPQYTAAASASQPQSPPQDRNHGTSRGTDQWGRARQLLQEASRPTDREEPGQEAIKEPIANAARGAWDYFRRSWHGDGVPRMSPLKKVFFVGAIVMLFWWFAATRASLAEVAIQSLIVYAIYYAFWTSIIRPGLRRQAGEATRANPASDNPASAAAGTTPRAQFAEHHTAAWPAAKNTMDEVAKSLDRAKQRRRSRVNWRERANQQLVAKPMRQKLTELLGSMLMASVFAAIFACAIPLLAYNPRYSELIAAYIWLATVGTLGSWAILIPSKFVEGRLEDHVPMRVTLMLSGALVGVAAWLISDVLLLKMPTGVPEPIDASRGLVSHDMLGWPKVTDGANPHIAMYVAYFAFLFLLPRWWRLTEYIRGTRMSLWLVVSCVFVAWMIHIFWWFPQPIGMIVAAVIALSTQLASPWMPPSQRRALSEATESA